MSIAMEKKRARIATEREQAARRRLEPVLTRFEGDSIARELTVVLESVL